MDNPETQGANENGQYRDTGNIGHTKHMTKTNKHTHNKTRKSKKMSKHGVTKITWVNPGAHEG